MGRTPCSPVCDRTPGARDLVSITLMVVPLEEVEADPVGNRGSDMGLLAGGSQNKEKNHPTSKLEFLEGLYE